MAASSSSAGRPTHSPSPAPDTATAGDGRPARRKVVPPSRFRTSSSPPAVHHHPLAQPTASSSTSSSSSTQPQQPPPRRQPPQQQQQLIQPLPSRARSRLASSAALSSSAGTSRTGAFSAGEEAATPRGRRVDAIKECAESGFPPRHVKPRVVDDDLRDKVLMAVCAALASLVSRRVVYRLVPGLVERKGFESGRQRGRIPDARASLRSTPAFARPPTWPRPGRAWTDASHAIMACS